MMRCARFVSLRHELPMPYSKGSKCSLKVAPLPIKLPPKEATRQQRKHVKRHPRIPRSKAPLLNRSHKKPSHPKPQRNLRPLNPAQSRLRLHRQTRRKTRPRRSSPLGKSQRPDIYSLASAAVKRTPALAARFNELTWTSVCVLKFIKSPTEEVYATNQENISNHGRNNRSRDQGAARKNRGRHDGL